MVIYNIAFFFCIGKNLKKAASCIQTHSSSVLINILSIIAVLSTWICSFTKCKCKFSIRKQ